MVINKGIFAQLGIKTENLNSVAFFKGGTLHFNMMLKGELVLNLLRSISKDNSISVNCHGSLLYQLDDVISDKPITAIMSGPTHSTSVSLGKDGPEIPTVPLFLKEWSAMLGSSRNIGSLCQQHLRNPKVFNDKRFEYTSSPTANTFNPNYILDVETGKFIEKNTIGSLISESDANLPKFLPITNVLDNVRNKLSTKSIVVDSDSQPIIKKTKATLSFEDQGETRQFESSSTLYYNISYVFVIFDEHFVVKSKISNVDFQSDKLLKNGYKSMFKEYDALFGQPLGSDIFIKASKRAVCTVFFFRKDATPVFIDFCIEQYNNYCRTTYLDHSDSKIIPYSELKAVDVYSPIAKGHFSHMDSNQAFNMDTWRQSKYDVKADPLGRDMLTFDALRRRFGSVPSKVLNEKDKSSVSTGFIDDDSTTNGF